MEQKASGVQKSFQVGSFAADFGSRVDFFELFLAEGPNCKARLFPPFPVVHGVRDHQFTNFNKRVGERFSSNNKGEHNCLSEGNFFGCGSLLFE